MAVIFTETNLGTRIAVPISTETTTKEFKKEFEKAHFNCFPRHGKIKVKSIMVKKKLHFYHLSESLPLKQVFEHSKGSWFLHIELNNQPAQKRSTKKETKILSKIPKRNKIKDHHAIKKMESPCETLDETGSISGLIAKYFSYNDEVTSAWGPGVHKTTSSLPVAKLSCERSCKKPEVGKRLMVAGLSVVKRNLKVSICKYREEVSVTRKTSSCVRSLVYEISDSDEND